MCAKEDTNAMPARDSTAFIVGASAQEFDDVQRWLPGWKCVDLPGGDCGPAVSPTTATPRLVVVYALKDEKATLAVRERLRNAAATSRAPILLVVGRYLISAGIAMRRLGNADFILSPLDEKRIREKIAGLVDG